MSYGGLALVPSPFLHKNPNPSFCQPNPAALRRSFRRSESTSIGFPGAAYRSRRWYSSSLSSPSPESSSSLDLPLLPFQIDEVLVPSECKNLHLYEARYLALLEESLTKRNGLFVHFVLDPVFSRRSSEGESFAARYGCLVIIESIKRLEVGALISIRGIGRVSIVDLMQMEPYLRGAVVPLLDDICYKDSALDGKIQKLRELLDNLHDLQIKLKVSKDEILETQIKNSLVWAHKNLYENCDQAFVPKLAERISFSALQPVSGMSNSELLTLQKEKLRAMDSIDTLERLDYVIQFVKQNINMVAAKLAIQSLEM